MIKAVFMDIDWTLLSHRIADVPKSARIAVKKLHDNGIKVFIASGRNRKEFKNLPCKDMFFDGYILMNGQVCLDKELEVIGGFPLDENVKEELLSAYNSMKFPMGLREVDEGYINFSNELVEEVLKSVSTKLPPIHGYTGKPLYMGVAYLKSKDIPKLLEMLPSFTPARWHADGIDLIPPGAGKEKGMDVILDYYDLKPEESMAIGDAENDIMMLKKAQIGVAMGNAIEEVKKIADYVTTDIDEDGIYNALRHFELI